MSKYNTFNTNSFSVHQKIVQSIGKEKKVLDVGCAEGNLSEKMNINECEVIGIELDKNAAKKAQKYCKKVFIGDVEEIELKDEFLNYFDFIIFADILEHLKYPMNVLKEFMKYLKDDGRIIVSLPNIANWRIRFKLLMGNLDYESQGILDEGHLRFFTEKNAKKLLRDSGLKISKFDITVGDVKRFASFFHFIGMLWPNFLAFQFLIIAEKKKLSIKV
ncbi:class I SAM-dependent methyltransferase [Methanobacterium sp.]|uniref:class I SAM-dependent methyltransferase n=1 Tax=Methanobacterium sp. TaxID=2164 RepID=UPI003C70D264